MAGNAGNYKPIGEITPEQAEAYAELTAQHGDIVRAQEKMVKALRNLSSLGQKAALQGIVASWLIGVTDSEAEAHQLADHLASEFHGYIAAAAGHDPEKRH